MTPEREPGDTALGHGRRGAHDVRKAREAPAGPDPLARDPLAGEALAREAAAAAGPVPAPRPEVLTRVLDGLRDLPAVTRAPRDGDGEPGGARPLPLPRRRR